MKNIIDDTYLASLHFFDLARIYFRQANNEVTIYNLLFSIAMAAQPSTIVELGTGPGISSMAFIRTLQYWQRRDGRKRTLHSCDIDPMTLRQLKRFAPLAVTHEMPTDTLAAQWEKENIEIDLLYIDADHSHEQSLADFKNFSRWVKPNGLILMHDTFPLTATHEDLRYSGTVWKTAQYIKAHERETYEIMTLPFLCGLGLVRKKGAKYF